jgi:hypothetical protein
MRNIINVGAISARLRPDLWVKPDNDLFISAELTRPRIDFSADLEQEFIDASKTVAGYGWTIPASMSPREFFYIATLGNRESVDNCFLDFYERSNCCRVPGPATGSTSFVNWHNLLTECYASYQSGRYVICIPALITILEGAITFQESTSFRRGSEREAFFNGKIAACGDDMLARAFWESVYVFTSSLFQYASFEGTRPPAINRHWILHGRDVSDWRQADALRLFQALETLGLIFDFNLPHSAG